MVLEKKQNSLCQIYLVLTKFKYSFYWKPGSNGNLIYKGKRNKANVKLDLLYVGEENTKDFVKKYLIGNGLSTELQEGTTDGKKSYTSITIIMEQTLEILK